ncbi:hypothetical protein [Anaerocolumna xylanovorans]|uniref:Uncharacterized protein n=1 Tax=Anaerocolumna xylanovorans DSM 12503 TaxID=1121345 RepID=A0A1M7YGM1_9FIRM|nr:hypothetical protein [Anaerocolumna xylanovorans]SHO51741.1 hypothetical protein SAMN02745217_03305 [Anaerocolumna xylanovorans DSM 12503]
MGSYGILQIPSLSDLERSSIKEATNDFKYGLKITSVTSLYNGTTVTQNLYNPWTAYLSTKIGSGEQSYTGTFTDDIKVLWY